MRLAHRVLVAIAHGRRRRVSNSAITKYIAVCDGCGIYCRFGEHKWSSLRGSDKYTIGVYGGARKTNPKSAELLAEFIITHVSCRLTTGIRIVPLDSVPGMYKEWLPTQKIPRPKFDNERCWAGIKTGDRCALDRGHYRSQDDAKPSPHVSESGRQWY